MDAKVRKQVLQMLHNGIYVMTTRCGGQSCASIVTWLSQASFRPPMIMAALRKDSRLFEALCQSGIAALHVLSAGQIEVARKFLAHIPGSDGAFRDEPYDDGVTTAPVLCCAPAYLECKLSRTLDDLGDHAVVLMEVVEAQCRRDGRALSVAETPWKYGG